MSRDVVIRASGLGKRYTLGKNRRGTNTLRDVVSERLHAVFRRGAPNRSRREPFWALKDVSFEITRGENTGIIGMNGAGKSTLLKVLSRITRPTEGTARVVGRVGALLEVGTGFHRELTGRENVFLYGAILGMTKREIDRKYDAIVAFAGIGDFIDTPIKRYSSGMHVRLAFAVSAHLDPDILFLDEVLSVGDLAFQRKCIDFAKSLQERDATILFVSHNMFSIKTMCARVIYLRGGRIEFDGPTDEGIERYEEDCRLSALDPEEKDKHEWPIIVTDLALADESGARKLTFEFGERMHIKVAFEARQRVERPNFILAFVRADGVACCNFSTEADGVDLGTLEGSGVIELRTPPLKLVAEVYTVHLLVREPGFQRVLCAQVGSTFHVRHALLDSHFGVFHESAEWAVPPARLARDAARLVPGIGRTIE
jgi:lipopolysaccharide transport system ATP-binding protein